MARKPVKKRTPSKMEFKIVAVKPRKFREPKFKLEIGSDGDPFYVNPQTIPDGVALQWVTTEILGEPVSGFPFVMSIQDASKSGWRAVKGAAPVGGQILMWATSEVAESQRNANIDRARRQLKEIRELFRMDEPHFGEGRRPLVSESFMASEPYQSIASDAPPIDVHVALKFRLSARFQEAAEFLKITPEVYAQRRLELYLRGELGGILLPSGNGTVELFESGNFNIISRKS